MPRSVKASRVQVAATATGADLPTNGATSTYTLAFTVPTRGVVKKATMIMVDNAAFTTTGNQDGSYLHTTADGGAGKDTLVAGDAAGVLAAFAVNQTFAQDAGFDILFASSTYVAAYTLALTTMAQGGNTQTVAGMNPAQLLDIYYDVSGTPLGPTQGTGTLYWTLCGAGATYNYTTLTSFKVVLDIEPCP